MNVVTVLASPRPEGNTERILGWVEGALKDGEHAVERIHLNLLDIRDCAACLACAESADEPGCAIRDDVPGVFEKVMAADAVVFASPLYMWGVTGTLKMLHDRSLCLVRGWGTPEHRSFVEGERVSQLITCGGGEGGNTEPAHLPNTHGSKARELAERLME